MDLAGTLFFVVKCNFKESKYIHSPYEIYKVMGEYIMPHEGIVCVVLSSETI